MLNQILRKRAVKNKKLNKSKWSKMKKDGCGFERLPEVKVYWSNEVKKNGHDMYRHLKTDPLALPLWRVSPRGSSFGSLVTLGVPQPTEEKERHLKTPLNIISLGLLRGSLSWQECIQLQCLFIHTEWHSTN